MAITLADVRNGRLNIRNLSLEDQRAVGAELEQEFRTTQAAETAQREKVIRASEKNRGLNETGPQQPRPVRDFDRGTFSGAVETADPAAVETARTGARAQAADVDAELSSRTATELRLSDEAAAIAARDRSRGLGSEAPTTRRAPGGTGFTASQFGDIESRPGIVERGLRAVGATGAADKREAARVGARESLVLEPATARPAGGELDVEDRPLSKAQQGKVGSLQANIDTANERKRRAQRTINTSRNPADVAAAKEAITQANKDIQGATARQATTRAEARTPTPVSDVAANAKRVADDPLTAADNVVNAVSEKAAEIRGQVEDVVDTPENRSRAKKFKDDVVNTSKKALNKVKSLGGKGGDAAASKSAEVDAAADKVTDKVKDRFRPKARGAVITGASILGVAELADGAKSFARDVDANGLDATIDSYKASLQDLMLSGVVKINEIDEAEGAEKAAIAGRLALDVVKGMAVSAASSVSNLFKDDVNTTLNRLEFLGLSPTDARFGVETVEEELPISNVQPTPQGFRAPADGERFVGVQPIDSTRAPAPTTPGLDPNDPAFIGPEDPGVVPGTGLRFDPTAESFPPDISVTQDPFLTAGRAPGTFDISGLRSDIPGGGTGTIDVSRATGGPEGFAQRVEQSRRAGAFEPVSQARRDEAAADLNRVRRGTDAIRDLAATRMGVPVQYLDAVRSGSMTPREANLAQAKQAATGNLPTPPTAQEQQDLAFDRNEEIRTAQSHNLEINAADSEALVDAGERMAAASFPGDEERQDAAAGNFPAWFAAWAPTGTVYANLSAVERERFNGEYSLLGDFAKDGEGFWRGLDPTAPDIRLETLTDPGTSILDSMFEQGTLFDIGDDNSVTYGTTDSSGSPVTLTLEAENMSPAALSHVNRYRAAHPERFRGRQGLQR